MLTNKIMNGVIMAELDDLILAALSGQDDCIAKLAAATKQTEVSALRDSAANFDLLFEEWNNAESYTPAQAAFAVALGERDALESQDFRNALYESAKVMLPPYISSQAVLKAVGPRDTAVQAHEVVRRIAKLQKVPTGALVYFPETKNWGKLASVDRVSATFSIQSLKTNNLNSYPISITFSSVILFESHQEMFNMIVPGSNLPASAAYRKAFKAHCITDLSDEKIKEIICGIVVPVCFNMESFEAWWSKEAITSGTAGQRAPWEARSILELSNLLAPYAETGIAFNEDQANQLTNMFKKIRPNIVTKDAVMLAECISILSIATPGDVLQIMFTMLRGVVPFWPASVDGITISKQLEVWGHISVKLLSAFVKASCQLYTPAEMAKLGCKLPGKCLTVLFFAIDMKEVTAAVFAEKSLSSDVLMFIWKNRTKLPRNLTFIVDMERIASALSVEGLPKEWASAQRDLKRALFEKQDFQKFVIDNADGDTPSIVDAIQKIRTFQSGEYQSLMVKLAKHSEELQSHIEKAAKRLMKNAPAEKVEQVPVTSSASLAKLVKELDDIINVQIPENVKAIAHARSYGDFRENAEYDAAKERRRFLHKRRNELETTIGSVESTDFANVKVADIVVLGSTVTLTDKAGNDSVYYILGAWDGDPDRNRISYQTVMGKALMEKKIGAEVQLPNGDFTVKAIAPLPEDLRKELADEANGN